ncbi:MAG: hypothetical protein IT317_04960 [Anaerolineales bacterium]|nr:hypothetical protein [Anaerolineales bacterium]
MAARAVVGWLCAVGLAAAPVGVTSVGVAGAAPLAPAAGAVARCEPAAISTLYTSPTTFDLYVQDAVDLYGVDFQLTFDTSLAQVGDDDGVAAGVQITPLWGFLSTGYVVKRTADNTAGTIWYAATQLYPTAPVTGSGAVARVTLLPQASGTFTLTFTNAQLARTDGSFIPVTSQDCAVTLTTPVPTTSAISPTTALANGAGFSLTVTGTNFISGSVVYWGSTPLVTTFISGTQLVATVPPGLLLLAGPISVTVVNPAPGGGPSNGQLFTVLNGVRWTASAYDADEAAGSAVLTTTLDAPSSVTVTVGVTTSPGTAGALDFTPLTTTVTFAPGQVTRAVTVTLTNDALDEPDETFTVALSAPTNAALGAPAEAVVTIRDDDAPPQVRFAASSSAVSEGAGSAPITVTLSASSSLTVTVGVATSPGTAGAADYMPLSTTVTFAPGEVSRTVTVTLTNDALDESNETFTAALSAPTNAALGVPAVMTVTIADDDAAPSVRLSSPVYTATESAGSAPITLTLSAASGLTVTVVLTTSNGTALAGSDYTPLTVTLTFTPGAVSRTAAVVLLNDATAEPDETLRLGLSAAVNAVLGAPAGAILTVQDDDAIEVRLLLPLAFR